MAAPYIPVAIGMEWSQTFARMIAGYILILPQVFSLLN